MKRVSLIIPVYNEESVLSILYDRLCRLMDSMTQYEWELLFVNDGSTDTSAQLINDFMAHDRRVAVVELSRNFGKEAAMLAGFDYVTGDCAVIMDADL